MALREFECVFADQTPFFAAWRHIYDREKGEYVQRYTEMRLSLSADKVTAPMDTPNAVQVLSQHGSWFGEFQSVGRVRELAVKGTTLVGTIALSEDDVRKYVQGGLESIEQGINAGLSIAFDFVDNPIGTWKMGDGTREKPDRFTVGAIKILEVSLTPVPRLRTAGITRPVKKENTE